MSDLQSKIQKLVSDFSTQLIDAITEEILGVRSTVHSAARTAPVKKVGRPRRAAAAAPAEAAPAGKRRRRGGAADGRRLPHETENDAKAFAAFVYSNPGQRVRAAVKALGMSTPSLALPIAKAVANGWVRKEGQRSATTYHPGEKHPGAAAGAAAEAPAKGKPGRKARKKG